MKYHNFSQHYSTYTTASEGGWLNTNDLFTLGTKLALIVKRDKILPQNRSKVVSSSGVKQEVN